MKKANYIYNYMANKKNFGESGTGMVTAPQEMNGFTNHCGVEFANAEELKAFMKERTGAVKYAGISGYRAAFIKLSDGTIELEQWVANENKPGQPLMKRTTIIGKRLNENRWNQVFEDMRSFIKEWVGGLADKVLEAADVEPEAEEEDEDYNGFESREMYEEAKETAENIIGDCEVYWTTDWWDHERLKVVFADGSCSGEHCVFLDEDEDGHISVEVRAACTDLTWEVMDKIADLRAALKRGDFDEVFGVEEELPF